MADEEQKLKRLYGKLPSKKNILGHKLQERKYFDSGDYALSKAGKTPADAIGGTTPQIGSKFPSPESIPHSVAAQCAPGHQGMSSSPVKESLLGTPPMELTRSERGRS